MFNIGIIGCGVLGGTMKKWIEEHNSNCKILVLDPSKGYNDDLSTVDIIFISIHIPTNEYQEQDLTELKSIIVNCPNIPIFIRTTLLPGTCDKFANEFGKDIYFMPEFLTERTAYEDFCSQKMIFTGCEDMLKQIFIGKSYIVMSNKEAEIAKYAHNVFGALKVTYFNGIYELTKNLNCDYEKVKDGFLLSNYINPMHTNIPGPDGKRGFGGKCFPKDITAFSKYISNMLLGKLLDDVISINDKYRNS